MSTVVQVSPPWVSRVHMVCTLLALEVFPKPSRMHKTTLNLPYLPTGFSYSLAGQTSVYTQGTNPRYPRNKWAAVCLDLTKVKC